MKKHLFLVFLFLGSLLVFIPQVSATAEAVGGVSAYVTNGGTDGYYYVRFHVSENDPNQDTGDFTYNITVSLDGDPWINYGEFLGEPGNSVGGGFRNIFLNQLGVSASIEINVTADDGTGPVDSCTVTIDTAVTDDYDACGDMDPTYSQNYCVPRSSESTSLGWNYARGITVSGADQVFEPGSGVFAPGKGNGQAIGGLNLPGDSGSYEFRFNIDQDGNVFSQTVIFLSTVPGVVSEANVPEATTPNTLAGAIPRSGAARNGVGLVLLYDKITDETNLYLYRQINGNPSSIHTETWAGGTLPLDVNTAGTLRVDSYSDTVNITLGASFSKTFKTSLYGDEPGAFHSLWLRETGGTGVAYSTVNFDRDGTNLCLYTAPEALGGSAGAPGFGGSNLESFDGEAGYQGDRLFPGLDVNSTAQSFGMSERSFGFLLFGILFLAFALGGFFAAGAAGAFLGGGLSVGVGAVFNLLPYWVLILVFLAAVGVIVLRVRGGGE